MDNQKHSPAKEALTCAILSGISALTLLATFVITVIRCIRYAESYSTLANIDESDIITTRVWRRK